MMQTFLTLALSLFSLSSFASAAATPTYVCTTLDNIDRFDNASAVEFPEKWFRTSYNGACVYECEPYQAIGDLNVGFHVSCGTIDTSKMVEMDMLPGMVTIPPYLYSDYSDGTFKAFSGSQEYTICVYKNSSIEGEGGDCGYREDITRALNKALATPAPKTVDTKTVDTKTVDAKTANAKTADVKPVDTKTANAKPANAKPVDTKTADTKPANAKPVDTKTADTKPVDKYRIAYNKLRHIHSKLLKKYNEAPSKVLLEKMKKVRAQMKVLLVLMH